MATKADRIRMVLLVCASLLMLAFVLIKAWSVLEARKYALVNSVISDADLTQYVNAQAVHNSTDHASCAVKLIGADNVRADTVKEYVYDECDIIYTTSQAPGGFSLPAVITVMKLKTKWIPSSYVKAGDGGLNYGDNKRIFPSYIRPPSKSTVKEVMQS